MATPGGGKKGKKKKGGQKTVSLNEFLGADAPTFSPSPSHSKSGGVGDWADEADDLGPVDLAEEYGGPKKPSVDISKLPSAPRASRGLDVDLSKLPSKPPYTAFLGNLPFDISEEEIRSLFRGLRVENIRFPQDQGRTKGFGYAEFHDVEQLKNALALNGEKIRNRPVRIDIADQAGKDNMSGDRMTRGFGNDDRTDGDWRRGGDDIPPINERRGGGGGFDRRGPRDDTDGRPAGPADTDECWRRDDPPVVPASNGWSGDRGPRSDDGWGRRQGGGFRDDRGPRDFRGDRGPRDFRDDRGPRDFRDDRGPRDFRDDRGPRDFRDDRGPRDFRDDRGPRDFRDDRGPRNFRDDRGTRDFKDDRGPRDFRDDRGPRDFRDDRGPRDFRDDRGPRDFRDDRGPRDFRDDRGPRDFRDDRGPRDFRDDRGPRDFRDDRGPRDIRDDRGSRDFRDDRGPPPDGFRDDREQRAWRNERSREPQANEGSAPDLVPAEPKERPKLSLKPRTVESADSEKSSSSSIFGGARPVDTAAKERQIEEKLSSMKVSPVRQNRERSRDDKREGRSPPKDVRVDNEDGDEENWRNENVRHDKTRVMRPDLILEAEKGQTRGRISSEDSDKGSRDTTGRSGRDSSRGRGRGRGRSNERKKPRDVLPPKYEEPQQPVFGQSSKFSALLGDDDDEEDEIANDSSDVTTTAAT